MERFDPVLGGKVVIYWISDFSPFSSDNANPLFRELRKGEKISVHNCVFVRSNKLQCFFGSKPRSKTKFSVTVKVVGGKVVEEQVKSEEENNSSFRTYGYYLSDFSAEVRENGEYSFTITANADSTVKEKDYSDNRYVTRGQKF
ncbi:hypothetical protein [Dyadobacter sp. 676]|uniref:CARDB domain-containing protein n=1 Tax=Dyadobacter sp. 676 TaxID=3088362 RepID=A0AAU8FKW1_9BACT